MPSKKAKTFITLGCIILGTLLGSIISAAMLYPHYPEETFILSEFLKNSLGAFIYSPLSMTFGVFPTIGFYTLPHAPIVILGFLLALTGVIAFPITGKKIFAILILLGCAMWAHNNYLAFNALMSV